MPLGIFSFVPIERNNPLSQLRYQTSFGSANAEKENFLLLVSLKFTHLTNVHEISWLFTALFAAGAIAMVCGFVRNGNEFNFADPIAFIMFAFYATSIIVIFIGLVISCRNQVARVIEYNHTWRTCNSHMNTLWLLKTNLIHCFISRAQSIPPVNTLSPPPKPTPPLLASHTHIYTSLLELYIIQK